MTERSLSPLLIWLHAVRPRTLPLAVASIVLGYGLARMQGRADAAVFLLALLTALLLQILSNLANDYGDAVSGADMVERLGPRRMVGSGLTTPAQMARAVVLAALLALASGLVLVGYAAWGRWGLLIFFLTLGLASVAAAVAYTVGRRPYGYRGLGDPMTCIFFGPVAVLGSAVLCGARLEAVMWLPALAAGLCTAAVLNINNMRDLETDRISGKLTVAARLGLAGARRYHAGLIVLVLVLWLAFWLCVNARMLPALLLALPLLRSTWLAVTRAGDAACLNRQLRATVLSSALLDVGMACFCLLQ